MPYSYSNSLGGDLKLFDRERAFEKYFFADKCDKHAYTIAWNSGGAQEVIIDEVSYTFPANTVLPLMLNQSFRFEKPEHIVAWQFNREFYCILDHDAEVGCIGFLFYGVARQVFIDLEEKEETALKNILEVFKDEFEDVDEIQGDMLRMLLVRLIIKITRLARRQYLPEAHVSMIRFELMRKFQLLVELNYRKEHQVKFYAAALHKSPKTLSNVFGQVYNKTPIELIQQRLIDEATRLLLYTEKSSKEISSELGFLDAGHFSRFFKKSSGRSPSDFRKTHSHST